MQIFKQDTVIGIFDNEASILTLIAPILIFKSFFFFQVSIDTELFRFKSEQQFNLDLT